MISKNKKAYANQLHRRHVRFSRINLGIISAIFAVIGTIILIHSFAAPNPNLPGDLNNDNTVNALDLSILISDFGTSNSAADINGDGQVNVLDLSILLAHYGQSLTPPPTISFSASPTSISSGSSSTLSWSSTNASSCTASGAWSGTKTNSGSQSVSPTATSSYTLTCSGAGGSANASVTVAVSGTGPAPFPSVLHQCGIHICDSNNYQMPTLKSFNLLYQWSQSDFNDMYTQGARMVRVLVIWSKLEPTNGNIDMNYVTTTVDPMVARATAAHLYVNLEIVWNAPSNWPSWAGSQVMSNWMAYGEMPTHFLASRYGNPQLSNGSSNPQYSKAVMGFGICEPHPDDYTALDKLPTLESQQRTWISWFRQDAPTWIGIVSDGYGGSTPIYNDPCAAEQGKQMNGINASDTAYDSVGGNVILDLHDYYEGDTQAILNYDGRNSHGDDYNVLNGGTQVGVNSSSPSVYPSPKTGFQDRSSLVTQLKGMVCPYAQYQAAYDGGKGIPVEIGEFGWNVGSSTTTLQSGSGYAEYIADQQQAWSQVSPVIEQEWDYSHNQANGQDLWAAKPNINGTPTWQPFTLDWLSSSP